MWLSSLGSPVVGNGCTTGEPPAIVGPGSALLGRNLPANRSHQLRGRRCACIARHEEGDLGDSDHRPPLETGFNLVTGKGRAEIEFEDASTLYLADNSALTFNDLRTTAGVPYTELALLCRNRNSKPERDDRRRIVRLYTPARKIAVFYPTKMYERVSSYLDAMDITPLKTA